MAYPQHYLLAWGGTLHGAEEHATGLRFVKNAGSEIEESHAQTFMAHAATALETYVMSAGLAQGYKIEWIKFNEIGPEGRYANATGTNRLDLATPIAGTSTTAHPPQIACAVTLLTDAQRGMANKGRFYQGGLGLNGFAIDPATGTISQAAAETFRNRVQTLLNTLNDNPGLDAQFGGLDVHVVSKGGLAGPGVARKVTAVKVGRVLDTQRRRRGNIAESYVAPVPVS